MSATPGDIAAAAVPITLRINDVEQELWAEPLTDLDIIELDRWVQAELLKAARLSCEGASEADKELTMRVAMQEAMGMSWYSGTGLKLIATVMGMSRLMWQMLKKRHPTITVEQIRQAMLDPKKLREANEIFRQQNLDPLKAPQQRAAAEQQGSATLSDDV